MSQKKLTEKELFDSLSSLTPKELEKLLAKLNKAKQTDFVVTTAYKETLDDKLFGKGKNKKCPYCNSVVTHRKGKRRYIEYRCTACNTRYSAVTNTLMDGSTLTFEQWKAILHHTIIGNSVADTVNVLKKDYGLEVTENTVHLARHKIFHFVSLFPQPKLTGVIQIDEVHFRESQKASKTLVNNIPHHSAYRKPRYGYQPSLLGVMGNEFMTIPVAVDSSGHIVAKVACMGKLTVPIFYDLFHEHLKEPAYICTDAHPVYTHYCRTANVPHYIRPSDYLKMITKAGYDQPRYPSEDLNTQAIEKNNRILEKLYSTSGGDYIYNRGDLSFKDFQKIKKDNKLSLSRVNQQHSELKRLLNTNKHGVSGKFLDKYISFYCFIHNWRIDKGGYPSSMADSEEILLYILKNAPSSSFTAKDYKGATLRLPKATKKYMDMLANLTSDARMDFNLKYLKLNEEDRVYNFNKRNYLLDCPKARIVKIAKEKGLKVNSKSSQWSMVSELLKQTDVDKIIVTLLLQEKKIFIDGEDYDLFQYFQIDPAEVKYNEDMGDGIKNKYPIVKGDSPLYNPSTYFAVGDEGIKKTVDFSDKQDSDEVIIGIDLVDEDDELPF